MSQHSPVVLSQPAFDNPTLQFSFLDPVKFTWADLGLDPPAASCSLLAEHKWLFRL